MIQVENQSPSVSIKSIFSHKATHVYHNISLAGRLSKYSAWFKGSPLIAGSELLSAERVDSMDRHYPLTNNEWVDISNGPWTASQGGPIYNGVTA